MLRRKSERDTKLWVLENLKLYEAEQGTGQQGKREQGLELHTIIGPTLGSSMSPSFRKDFAWLRVRKSYL